MISKVFQRIGNLFNNKEILPLDIKAVERVIGYGFRDKQLLLKAFKHRSYLSLTQEQDYESNERLEFLGDAVLDIIITEHLFHHFEKEREGALSQKKSILVSRQVLGRLAEDIGLGKFILINKGEEKTGGRTRLSNLANLFEAILGAIYLDGGISPVKKFVDSFLIGRRDEFLETKLYTNYKSILLEYSQAQGWGAPHYRTVKESGPDHQKNFVVMVNVNQKVTAKGAGSNKKKAEQRAAHNALRKIKQSDATRPSSAAQESELHAPTEQGDTR